MFIGREYELNFLNERYASNQAERDKKKHPFNGTVHYYLFSLNGFTAAVTDEAQRDSTIHLVTLEDILNV